MSKVKETSVGYNGGLFTGLDHEEGGIPAIVTDTNTPIEVEGDEALINSEATALHWKELSKINQSAGNGVPIPPPSQTPTQTSQANQDPTPVILTDTGTPIKVKTGQAIINAEATKQNWKELSKINQSAGNGVAIPNPADVSTEIRQKLEQGGKLTGKDRTAIYSKWKRLVNMTASELEKYYNSPDGKTSGLTEAEAKKQGIDSGRESARMIIKMKRTKKAEWTDDMWRWAGKQISFISRMRGVKGNLYEKNYKKTRKLKALLIWGHKPSKYKGSDTDFNDGGVTAEKFFEDEVGHLATPKDKKVERPYRVRFHLGAGQNFMKWKVENTKTKNVKFFEPETTTIHMSDCRLVNSEATATKIFKGEISKTPIAWVECASVDIEADESDISPDDRLAYNPRKSPNWNDADGDNIDNYIFNELVTDKRSVYFDAPDGKTYRVGGICEPDEFHLGGDMTKHLAPNGKPSNLTHEQYHLVRSPEFKAWFGDWENDPKEYDLLDENDEPKVWYHTGGDWTTLNDGGKSGKGKMMFSPTMKSMAYANESKDNTTRPFFIKCDYIYNLPYENRNKPAFYKWNNKKMNPIWFVNAYGGFIVVRQSNQIKLADGSNTTFDTNNLDIRFDQGGVPEYHLGGDMTINLAPNGKPSNLTHEQYHLVRSLEFKAWFGDWEHDPANASKVIDENGEPLIVYRGDSSASNKGNIFKTGFNRMGFVSKNRLPNKYFHYFVDQHEVAQGYAENQVEDHNTKVEYTGKGKKWETKVTPYFLNIRNPIDITPNNSLFPTYKEYIKILKKQFGDEYENKRGYSVGYKYGFSITSSALNRIFIDKLGKDYLSSNEWNKVKKYHKEQFELGHWDESVYSFFIEYEYDTSTGRSAILSNLYASMKNQGVDGMVFLESTHWNDSFFRDYFAFERGEIKQEPTFDYRRWVEKPKVFTALESNQIKLADGSNTTFDQNNPDIRYDQGGELIKRADGSYSRRGLWDNIRDNAGSGKKPTKEMLEQEAKIKSQDLHFDEGGKIDKALQDLHYAGSVKYYMEPEFRGEAYDFPDHGTPNSFFTTTSSGKTWKSIDIVAYDQKGEKVGLFSIATEGTDGNTPGAFKITTDPEKSRQGWGMKLLDEAQRQGIDIIGNIKKNRFSHSGRSLLRKWLEAQRNNTDQYDLGGQIQSLKNSLQYLRGDQFAQMEAYIRTLVEKQGIEDMSQNSADEPTLPPGEFDIDKKIVKLKEKYIMEVDTLLDGSTIEDKRQNILNWIHDKSKNVKVIIAFSGGKDSVAMVLQCLFKWKIPKDQIELWHHEVDGMGENLFDWKCTPSYCKAFAKAFGLKLLFSYANGGILREMYKTNELKQPIYFQEAPDGEFSVALPEPNAEPRTRRMFPAVSTDLTTRWCSSVVKIDVMSRAITNSARFDNANIVIMTGERRAESRPRAKYHEIEKYKSCSRKRQAITWRSIIDLTEAEIWDMFKEHKIQPHPCYELGWGRCSCQLCIFGQNDAWASINEISPEKVERIAEIEKDLNYDLYNEHEKLSANPKVYWQSGPNEGKERYSKGRRLNGIYEARVDKGKSMIDKEKLKRWGAEALGEFISPIFVEKWELPAGAFSTEQSGAN